MARVSLVGVVVLSVLGIGLGSCQGGKEAAAAKRNPEELGAEIGASYCKLMEELSAAVGSGAEASAVAPLVAQLKEKYVREMVELGRQREALAPNDRERCDGVARTRMLKVPDEQLQALDTAQEALRAQDAELAKRLEELRRVTRYANFDQLRAQLPDEAKRLGIQ
ncbi:MAG: hypothetical protein GYA57_12440 [Myxococcales bacterium]|nr:hypothetical protein [Myxococcales bacterium]